MPATLDQGLSSPAVADVGLFIKVQQNYYWKTYASYFERPISNYELSRPFILTVIKMFKGFDKNIFHEMAMYTQYHQIDMTIDMIESSLPKDELSYLEYFEGSVPLKEYMEGIQCMYTRADVEVRRQAREHLQIVEELEAKKCNKI